MPPRISFTQWPALSVALLLCACQSAKKTDAATSPAPAPVAAKPAVSAKKNLLGLFGKKKTDAAPATPALEVQSAAEATPAPAATPSGKKKSFFSLLKRKPAAAPEATKPTEADPFALPDAATPPEKKKSAFSWLKRKKKDPSATAPDTAPAESTAAEAPARRGFFGWFKKGSSTAADAPGLDAAFAAECQALGGPGGAVAGLDGWLFSGSELTNAARKGSSSTAVAAISDYARKLRSIGTELIVVPVPAKAHIYPDKVSKALKIKSKNVVRLDSAIESAIRSLSGSGVSTVDLTPAFMKARGDKNRGEPMLRTGQGWSPSGAWLAAREVASTIKGSKAGGRLGNVSGITVEDTSIAYTGGLATGMPKVKAEALPVRKIGRITGDKLRSISFKESGGTLLLMGDRTILSWREDGNPSGSTAAFCSLADQLAAELETIPDVMVNGEEPRNALRMKIMRERTSGRGTLSGTRAVVWVFPAADLLSSSWRQVPLQVSLQLQAPTLELQLQ